MSRRRGIVVWSGIVVWCASASFWTPSEAVAQNDAPPPGDPASVRPPAAAAGTSKLPIFFTAGFAFGRRSDACSLCASPENKDSFSAHASLGKYLGHGLGVGIDASVWRRTHPGPTLDPDSTGAPQPTSLGNTLGNASVTFSWQVWHVWIRAGGGLAWARQDVVREEEGAGPVVEQASGLGIGYSAGAGVTIPVAGPVSLAFYANLNGGRYDLVSPTAVLQRGAEHRYVEVGVGLTLR